MRFLPDSTTDYYLRLKSEVIDADLCLRCGTCVGVCPHGLLEIDDDLGRCLPVRRADSDLCARCDAECYLACPGRYVDFPALNQAVHSRQPDSCLTGVYRDLWVAHATDEGIRRLGSSGGVITAVIKHLFDTGRIEGAYVQAMDPARPYFPKPLLARSYEQAQTASDSKYTVCPHNVLLNDIDSEGGPLCFVGVPCQVHAIRKLQQAGHPVAGRFRYVIGPYCGNILRFDSTRAFLAKQGVTDLNEVVSLAYRAGEWPGNMRVRLRSGRVIEMPKFHANYLIPFYIMRRCLLCTDLTNEFTDISGGDAWAPVYEERGKGFSIMVVRTEQGRQLADEMIDQGRLSVTPIERDEAIAMHSHGLDLKKRGAFLRIARRRLRRRPVPQYGYDLAPGVPLARRLMETVMGLIFRICWTAPARRAIQCVPDRVIGWMFRRARTKWKAATRTAKRTGIGTMRFHVEEPGGEASADVHAVAAARRGDQDVAGRGGAR